MYGGRRGLSTGGRRSGLFVVWSGEEVLFGMIARMEREL